MRMFTRADELPEGVARLPVKSIHLNRSPIVIGNLRTLSPAMAERWGLDVDGAQQFAEKAGAMPELTAKMSTVWREVYRQPSSDTPDVDEDLYGGFISNADRRQLNRARSLAPQALATARFSFEDGRLDELLLRYRARNFPETLTTDEAQQWREHCAARLAGVDGWQQQLADLRAGADARGQAVLAALSEYALNLGGGK